MIFFFLMENTFFLLLLVTSTKFTIKPVVPDNNVASHEMLLEWGLYFLGWSSNRELTAQGPHHEKVNKKQMEVECKGCSLSKNRYICFEVLPQLAAAHSYPCSFLFISMAQTSCKWMKMNKTGFSIITTLPLSVISENMYHHKFSDSILYISCCVFYKDTSVNQDPLPYDCSVAIFIQGYR